MWNLIKLGTLAIVGMLLFITTTPTNAQRSHIQQGDSPNTFSQANSPNNHFKGVNAMPVLSGEVFMPFIFRRYPQGSFLGKIVFSTFRSGTTWAELFIMNADGSNQVPLVQDNTHNAGADWSPDNSHIVFTKRTHWSDSSTVEIYTMEADGTNQINLTNNDIFDSEPVWSPDGMRIAFNSRRDGNYNIFVMNADGTNPVQLTNSSYSKSSPTWSPDSQKIAYLTESPGAYGYDRIMVMNADGSNPVEIYKADDLYLSGLTWSPDGSKFAFSARLVGDLDTKNIFTIFANGANLKQLTFQPNNYSPKWSGDGTQLAYTYYEPHTPDDNVYVMNADGSSPQQLTHHPSPDGAAGWSN